MRKLRVWPLVMATCLLIGLFCVLLGGEPAADKKDKQAGNKPRIRVTISKETTYLTEPLRPDGYVDYLAALNQMASEGVTPENNFAVPFWQIMGPQEIDTPTRERYFKMLGIAEPPDEGEYFVRFQDFAKKVQDEARRTKIVSAQEIDELPAKLDDQHEQSTRRLWSPTEFPQVAAWITANDPHLDRIVAATRRPKFYSPLLAEGDPELISALLPHAQANREAARGLVARAMMRSQQGRFDAAWDDLTATHRLARLVGHGPTLVEGLVGAAIDTTAYSGDWAFASSGKLTAAQARKFWSDVKVLAPASDFSKQLEIGERLQFLDSVSCIARKGLASGPEIAVGADAPSDDSVLNRIGKEVVNSLGNALIDWDVPLRMGNHWHDRLLVAFKKPTLAERKAALTEFDKELKDLTGSVRSWNLLRQRLAGDKTLRELAGQKIGEVFVALMMPALSAVATVDTRQNVYRDLTQLAFALAAYRSDLGQYPDDLRKLAPKYIAEVPPDLFADSASGNAQFHYKREGTGYLLYSVGNDGIDDEGRDYNSDPMGDDLAVRTPPQSK